MAHLVPVKGGDDGRSVQLRLCVIFLIAHSRHIPRRGGLTPGLDLAISAEALGFGAACLQPRQNVVVGVVGGQVQPEVGSGRAAAAS